MKHIQPKHESIDCLIAFAGNLQIGVLTKTHVPVGKNDEEEKN